MSAATARKAALAYWGFAPKAAARASKGVDLQVHGECGTAGLDEAAACCIRPALNVIDQGQPVQ